MILTEKQATAKRCLNDRTKHCIASRCVGWEWFREEVVEAAEPRALDEPARPANVVGEGWAWHPFDGRMPARWEWHSHTGYCSCTTPRMMLMIAGVKP
mgnify:FL=1